MRIRKAGPTKHEAYVQRYRSLCGRRRTISRQEMANYLIQCASDGLDLRGHSLWYGMRGTEEIQYIASAIANAVDGITLVSIGGQIREIQYDQPGSMAPCQHAAISFVSADLARGDYDGEPQSGSTMEYLRNHAVRVVAVIGDRLPTAPPPPPMPVATAGVAYSRRQRQSLDAPAGFEN